jgi:hypothetical protein
MAGAMAPVVARQFEQIAQAASADEDVLELQGFVGFAKVVLGAAKVGISHDRRNSSSPEPASPLSVDKVPLSTPRVWRVDGVQLT